jgi:hypothetical protein
MRQSRIKITREEDGVHLAILNYLRTVLPHGWLVKHVPNKPRSAIAGLQQKRMGAIAGWPDLMIFGCRDWGIEDGPPPEPVTFFIEVKASKGRTQDNQIKVHDDLKDLGYSVGIARSIDDCRKLCKKWNLPIKDLTP